MFGSPPLSTHPVDVGQRTEATVIARLVAAGHAVLLPWGPNQRYDIVIDREGRFYKVQIKTACYEHGALVFATRSTRINSQRIFVRGYRGEIDLFVVYSPHTDRIYAVPPEEVSETVGTLRVEPTANNQTRGVRWAADYELPA